MDEYASHVIDLRILGQYNPTGNGDKPKQQEPATLPYIVKTAHTYRQRWDERTKPKDSGQYPPTRLIVKNTKDRINDCCHKIKQTVKQCKHPIFFSTGTPLEICILDKTFGKPLHNQSIFILDCKINQSFSNVILFYNTFTNKETEILSINTLQNNK